MTPASALSVDSRKLNGGYFQLSDWWRFFQNPIKHVEAKMKYRKHRGSTPLIYTNLHVDCQHKWYHAASVCFMIANMANLAQDGLIAVDCETKRLKRALMLVQLQHNPRSLTHALALL